MKEYCIFLAILLGIYILAEYGGTIFPIMGDDHYFVDKNDIIHNKNCPYRKIPWFTDKPSKYDFIRLPQQEFCTDCFVDEEVGKLMILHDINIDHEINRLERGGADEDYINKRLEKYGY